jgi:hypothetical protein
MLAVLWRYYEALLHPASPIYVAESATVGGLGCLLGATMVAAGDAPFRSHLWGVLFEVDEAGFAELHAADYPSLYRTPDGRAHILCGPLALVNHLCAAPLAFSLLRKIMVSTPTASSSSSTTAQRRVWLEEFASLRAVYAQATIHCRVARSDEIMVNYFGHEGKRQASGGISFAGADCRCPTCAHGFSSGQRPG